MTAPARAYASSGPGYKTHPAHAVVMRPFAGRVSVWVDGEQLADSYHAMLLTESDHAPVYYLPLKDISLGKLVQIDHSTYCPFKGHASYWAVVGQEDSQPVMWSYAEPYGEAAHLSDRAAFYGDRVKIKVIDPVL